MSDISNGPQRVDDRSSPDDDTVALLLHLAGARSPVPAEGAASAKEAARAVWLGVVEDESQAERQRARFLRGAGGLLALAATLLAVVYLGLWRQARETFTAPVARVEGTSGQVDIEENTDLWARDVVATGSRPASGSSPRVALRMAGGAVVRVDADSRLRLVSGTELTLESGAVFVDSEHSALDIETPFGTVTHIGTSYEVDLVPGRSLGIRVREGQVILRGHAPSAPSGAGLLVIEAGEEIVVQAGVVPKKQAIPLLVVDRRPYQALFEWAAKGGGWELRYSSAETEAEALTETMNSAPVGPSLNEALELLLMGTGNLSARQEGVELIIEPAR